MPRRTHITVHEFSAVRDPQTGDAIVSAVPRIVKVARIEDVRPTDEARRIALRTNELMRECEWTQEDASNRARVEAECDRDWDRGDAIWEHSKKKPLPDEYRTQMTLTDGSLRFFITETVEQVQGLIDGKDE
jgi:hypothetical protein